ncbi:hypothetical protein [Hymenobacter jejuensis]|uniref:Uncharacterized protein n=1 Tax=Hymenobacter jejuensis TaxID=2502781 RepID=A0A5B7ZY88_9BACT|nr:hypothetical protein [Hymenobacter jejuensis]QDA59930.1 hypothetical protein FHG12_07315 [Hymenobacter jejuensis]
MIQLLRRRPQLFVFLLAFSLVASNAYLLLVNHRPEFASDEQNYLRMARGEFALVPTVHRYRILLPALARGVAEVLSLLQRFRGVSQLSLPLGVSFFILNTTFAALTGLLLYRIAKMHGATSFAALLGMVAVMTSGSMTYITGLALVDSPAGLVEATLFYALVARSRPFLLASIAASLVVKEPLGLFLPIAVYYGNFVPWSQRLVAVVVATLLAAGLHFAMDALLPLSPLLKPQANLLLHHAIRAFYRLRMLTSMTGLLAAVSVFGGFNLILLGGLTGGRASIRTWAAQLHPSAPWFLGVVFAQVLLSADISRMLLLAGPIVGTAIALILDGHPLFVSFRRQLDMVPRV